MNRKVCRLEPTTGHVKSCELTTVPRHSSLSLVILLWVVNKTMITRLVSDIGRKALMVVASKKGGVRTFFSFNSN